jgi:hypothetical protein
MLSPATLETLIFLRENANLAGICIGPPPGSDVFGANNVLAI